MPSVKCPKCETINAGGSGACRRCGMPLPRINIEPPRQPAAGPPQFQLQFRPGKVIANRYSVITMIGRGGMGCIYRVRDNVLKEEVALKTLLPQHARDKIVVERFFNEARIARALSHPNIVRVHDIGMTRTDDDNIIYISMELISGQSLRAMLEGLLPGERLPVKTALHIVDELCAALEYAHRHTIHRDIKPENVMVANDGTVKLMDFGISKLMDTTGLTGTSIVMGTPFYMSPEQLRNSAHVDVRADIYSIGVMLYEILTGNMPTGVPKPASQLTREVPPALDPIVAKCVEPDPDDRYQTVSELRAALRDIIAVLEGTKPAGTAAPARGKSRFFTKKVLGYALMAILVAVSGAVLYKLEQHRQGVVAGTVQKEVESAGWAATDAEIRAIGVLTDKIRATVAAKPNNEQALKILADATDEWAKVQKEVAARNEQALPMAQKALQDYVAALLWQPGMVFVPRGPVSITDGQTTETVVVDGFLIDQTEVTNAQYRLFCQALQHPHRYDLDAAPPDHPVSQVTFYDAQYYAAWAGKNLPTEAQWARAGYGDKGSPAFPWGDNWLPGACNAAGTFEPDVYEEAGPVQQFPQDLSWSGCYDMAGNLAEWTRTISGPLASMPPEQRDDAAKVYFGTYLVVRGGSYTNEQISLNARGYCLFEQWAPDLGFRTVIEMPRSRAAVEKFIP